MGIWESILVYVVIPLVVVLLIVALGLSSKRYRIPRYRPGQKWTYEPVWWTANPAGAGGGAHDGHGDVDSGEGADEDRELIRTARGGARGSW